MWEVAICVFGALFLLALICDAEFATGGKFLRWLLSPPFIAAVCAYFALLLYGLWLLLRWGVALLRSGVSP